MVDIEACVWPETASRVWPVFGGEAGTLTVLLERSPEDPLVTPAQAGVVQEGPAGNLPAEAVADEAALVDGGEDQGQQEDQREDEEEQEDDGDCEAGHQAGARLLQVSVSPPVLQQRPQRTLGLLGVLGVLSPGRGGIQRTLGEDWVWGNSGNCSTSALDMFYILNSSIVN